MLFRSKLGKDEDVCVISFKVTDKEPATDLMNFIEKSYDWVIDADVSSGEMDDGDYIVFVECERNEQIPANVVTMMNDIMNITGQKLSQWRVRYRGSNEDHSLTLSDLKAMIPLNSKDYVKRYGAEEIDNLKAKAGVKVTTKAPKNDYTESLRIAAGLI